MFYWDFEASKISQPKTLFVCEPLWALHYSRIDNHYCLRVDASSVLKTILFRMTITYNILQIFKPTLNAIPSSFVEDVCPYSYYYYLVIPSLSQRSDTIPLNTGPCQYITIHSSVLHSWRTLQNGGRAWILMLLPTMTLALGAGFFMGGITYDRRHPGRAKRSRARTDAVNR